jgi:DNA-directed RNA polymerase II subunit RPB1
MNSIPTGSVGSISFTIPTTAEIISTLSVVEITNPVSTVEFTKNHTIFDTRMGAFRNVPCGTCGKSFKSCPGHHGRIKLTKPCVNSKFLRTIMKKILTLYCFDCRGNVSNCACKSSIKMIKIKKRCIDGFRFAQGLKYAFQWTKKTTIDEETGMEKTWYVSIEELYNLIKSIPSTVWHNDFGSSYSHYTDLTELVFLKYVLVLPTTSRSPNKMGGEWRADSISRLYLSVLRHNIDVSLNADVILKELRDEYHYKLQASIDILFDVKQTNSKLRQHVVTGGGIRQRIDGKKGRMRMNLMGKRVEFSARTVLSGDPCLGINEVGIPLQIANDLSIPVTITRYNINQFVSGTSFNVKYVIKKDGRKYDANVVRGVVGRLEIGDIVERCLVNGDVVVVNRQPTLHRGSVIACYVRIFNCLTFRLNYSTMITLNADTDGDEVNIHVPQDLESRAELEELMLASTNIVSSQSSKPLVGCTQDSLLGCYLLSKEETIPMNDYMEVLYSMGLDDTVCDERATTYTVKGSRFVTAALNGLGVFISRYEPSKDFLLIDNVVQYGLINKAIVGTSDDSLIHHVFLMAGHKTAAEFIHLIQKAATHWLDIRGFSVGISDCIVDHEKVNFTGLEEKLTETFFKTGGRWTDDNEGELTDALGELTKLEPPPHMKNVDNRLLDMINSGAKGSMVNFNQITRLLGQQSADEGRITKAFSHGTRTLPHYTKYDHSASSRGLVENSLIKGLSPQEFFFHAQGGRVGIIDTACKTSVTGAQYRRLVKVTESLSVRDMGYGKRAVMNTSMDQVVQFEYGEDSYDATYLKRLKT